MAKKKNSKWVAPHKTKKDQIFVTPPGAEEVFTTTDGSTALLNNQVADGVSGVPNTQFFSNNGMEVNIILQAPNLFSVIDQQIRRGPGGQTFVDIVIDCEDILNATEYEVSISKAIT